MDAAQINRTISTLETHRDTLGNAVVDTAVRALHQVVQKKVVSSLPTLEAQPLTVLAVRVHSITTMLRALPVGDVSPFLQQLWQNIDETILNHRGMVHTHIGNYVLAFFGLDESRQNEAEWAIRAALQLRQTVANVHMEWIDAHPASAELPMLTVAAGLHTGPVFRTQDIPPATFEALGETVDFTFSLAHTAKPNSVLISAEMYQHVRGVFYVQQLPHRIALDSVGTTERAYHVKGAKPYAVRVISRSVEGIETDMVGRDEAVRALQSAIATVQQTGRAQMLVINGAAGIGKSRLLYEFDRWLEQRPMNLRLLQGRASFQTQGVPYSVLRDIFTFYFGIFASDSARTTRRKLSQGIADITGPADAETMAANIERLISFAGQTMPLFPTPPEQKRLEVSIAAVQAFFRVLTRDGIPAIIILEDIHWADAASLRVLNELWRHATDIPLLMICTTRPNLFSEHQEWFVANERAIKIDLPPLTSNQSSALIEQIFSKIPHIPPKLQSELISGANGNPLLLEEQIQLLIDNGVILPYPTRWRVDDAALEKLSLPARLDEVLLARFAKLPLLEQEMLQRAATIGRAFWNVALARMVDEAADQISVDVVNVVLENLRERGVILERESSPFAQTREYIFKHAALQTAILQTLPADASVAYHAQLAHWLIEFNGEQVDTYASLIAAHFMEANQPENAARWYLRAGNYALAVFAWDVALVHFEQVQQLLPNLPQEKSEQLYPAMARGMTLALWWQANRLNTRNPRAKFEQATAWAAQTNDVAIQSRVLHEWSIAERRWGDIARADELLTQSQSIMP